MKMENISRKGMKYMNVGERVCLYKEKLGHKNYQDFGRAANVSGDWVNELSKKTEIKVTDMGNVINLARYLGITIDQLVINDDSELNQFQDVDITNIPDSCDDIGVLLNELSTLVTKENIKMDGILMDERSKQIFKDSLYVTKTLTKQHLL